MAQKKDWNCWLGGYILGMGFVPIAVTLICYLFTMGLDWLRMITLGVVLGVLLAFVREGYVRELGVWFNGG